MRLRFCLSLTLHSLCWSLYVCEETWDEEFMNRESNIYYITHWWSWIMVLISCPICYAYPMPFPTSSPMTSTSQRICAHFASWVPCPRNVTHILVVNDVNMRSLLTYINERGRLYLLFIHKLGGGLRLFKINNNKKQCIGRNTGPRHRLEIERYAFVILGGKMETPSSFVSFYDNKERFFLLKKYDFHKIH